MMRMKKWLAFLAAVCLLLPAQDAVTLLVGKAVKSRRRCVILGDISSHTRRIPDYGAILYHIDMLRGKICLHIGTAPLCRTAVHCLEA